MSFTFKSLFILTTISVAISGCQTTQSMVSEEALAFKQLTATHCILTTPDTPSQKRKINLDRVHVYSITPRKNGWLAADVSSPAMYGRILRDSIYFKPQTGEFACGTKTWRQGNFPRTSRINIHNRATTSLTLSDIKMLKGQKIENVKVEHNGIVDSAYFFKQGEIHLKTKKNGHFTIGDVFDHNFYQRRFEELGDNRKTASKLNNAAVPAGVFVFMTYQDNGLDCFEFTSSAYADRKVPSILEGKLCEKDNEYIRADGLGFLSDMHHMNKLH